MSDSTPAPAHSALPDLGRVGLWTSAFDFLPIAQLRETAAELDELGYGALWFGETVGREALTQALLILESAPRIPVATGIANLWARDAVAMNGGARTLRDAHPGRFLLGLGVSHAPLVEGLRPGGNVYDKPLSLMRRYLDGLDSALYFAAGGEQPRPPRVLAALGPRMLDLARDRAEGAHTYLVTPQHTADARTILGPDKYLAVEQGAVLTTDRETALRRGREHLKPYLNLPNYRNNWLRLGLTEADLADGGSERLVDALVVWGDEATIRARVDEQFAAGADHVCLQVLGESMVDLTIEDWRRLAPALLT
ncbi:LLM class F420-dependent oxidoreductase [Yinghuangia seranimata]|uniref:LLM class F420-dependent oxidoreductase n=1 Tax=Yinghuangia seranimata TaxID=408067 RepID=UPI00248D23B1|nr:LLM class F420-dependent oxidoreductase [Yinghuangia seranimata]MDI2129766.1 LLM class F420-dependent oxidoreductase [Yinghuangia seranimata]